MIVLDMGSSVSPTYGEQEGTAYNGHCGCTCYHPLFVFNQLGDLERCALGSGNVYSVHGWKLVVEPVLVAVPKVLFQEILRLIDGLRPRPAPA